MIVMPIGVSSKPYAVIGVTYPSGSTCTCTNGSKTLTAKDTTGKALFVIPSAGTWTVKAVKGSQSKSKTVSITAEGQVEVVTLAYFSATIKVTYPAKSKCVIKNSSGTQVASDTNTGTSAKTWTATVGAKGTYTITATATDGSGKTKSTTVSITSDGQSASVTLTYELVLFNNGVVSGYAWDSSNVSSGYGHAQVSNGLISLGGSTWDDGLAFKEGWGEIGISSAIGLSDYSALKVHLKKIDSANGTATIQVGTTALGDNTATKTVTLTAGTTTSLDISSITGSKYISLYAGSNTGTYGNSINVYFDKVWLE